VTSTLIDGIGALVTNDPTNPAGDGSPLGIITDAAMIIENSVVVWAGRRRAAGAADQGHDLAGATVIPGFVDSHSHLVFAGDRAAEFAARMSGIPYTAGGIATTVAATRAATDDELRARMRRLLGEMSAAGTTTVEIKSGYGLDVANELRSLSIAAEATQEVTFLGAHVVPVEFEKDRDGYVDLVCGPMLDACASSARWIDVFCDRGAFDLDESRQILRAGIERGLLPRLHAHQLERTGAIELGVELGAASVDHCTHLDRGDLLALAGSDTVATVVPGADFSTRSPYANARTMVDVGVVVALATDCNPGTSYITSMPWCIATAVREMRLTPAEALWSATAGGARALRRNDVGALKAGKRADFAVIDAPSYVHLAYRPGVPLVSETWKNGLRLGEPPWE
jgi:imidazolonepropionase